MARRRAAGLLLALAACIATATAAPTASNQTALDLYDGAPDGCYYNFQHYGEGDRIMTNEPCLNCTCHNRMLMCYLRVCPFTKPIGQDCTIEKRADQCCPIVTCPDVPVDLLTSTTTSPAEYGPTGMGKLDKFGCSINGKYFPEGSKVPPTPNKPCEHCYCIRNMTTCVMQECTLHVDGCTPIYHKDVCCPVRYSCDHPEDEMPLLDDLSTTVRPTPGFLLTTTTISPVTQLSQDCVYDNRIFPDGALIKTEKACDHCYCMKGDIVCVVQECGTPMENEGKNCTALSPREGVCCPDTYICEGDDYYPTGTTYEPDFFTTQAIKEKLTTLSPPRRTSSEGSGYRNEPDEVPYTESPETEPELEGSGEDGEQKPFSETGYTDNNVAITEEAHEFIPLTTTRPKKDETKPEVSTVDETRTSEDIKGTTELHHRFTSTTEYSTKESEILVTDLIQAEDIGSGEVPDDIGSEPQKGVTDTSNLLVTEEKLATTEPSVIGAKFTEQDSLESEMPVTSITTSEEKTTEKSSEKDITDEISNETTISLSGTSKVTARPDFEEHTKSPNIIESSQALEETVTIVPEPTITTLRSPDIENVKKDRTTESAEQQAVTNAPEHLNKEVSIESQYYPESTSASSLDDEFVTTETHELDNDEIKESDHFVPQHVTASTPMLEEIEKDTTEYNEPVHMVTTGSSQDDQLNKLDFTTAKISLMDDQNRVTDLPIIEQHAPEYLPVATNVSEFDRDEITLNIPESTTVTPDILEQEQLTTASYEISDIERNTTVSDYDRKQLESTSSATTLALETEEFTTEPDKGLNTIPSDGVEEEIDMSQKEQKPTVSEDGTTTENLNRLGAELEGTISSTISETSVSKEELPLSTTESAFRKEDYTPTESQISYKLTTETSDFTVNVISTQAHDVPVSTESETDLKHGGDTTAVPKYTGSIEETTIAKEISGDTTYEITTSKNSVSEIESSEKTTTGLPLYEKETTTANQEDNEILNEPRIPGEGDCLLNGVTYTNESVVPSSNRCQSGCKCVSSIIKCDPIICSPPPEYMNNCETMYDTPNACCPTYVCDHKTETMPPQSHSQMSGTEAPVSSPVHCQGDECGPGADKKHQSDSFEDCKSGSCGSPSDESKRPISDSTAEQVPVKPITDQTNECVGASCTQDLCDGKNGCQASPVKPCESENCEPEAVTPSKAQPCSPGEDCHAKPELSEEKCKDDECRRKESTPLDHHIAEPCLEPDCKRPQNNFEHSTISILDQTSQDIGERDTKQTETTQKILTTTERLEKIETSKKPDIQEFVTVLPGYSSDVALTTTLDDIEHATKPKVETTTKLAEFTYEEQENTDGDITTEKNKQLSTKSPEYLPVSTETSETKDSLEDTISPLGDKGTEKTEISIILDKEQDKTEVTEQTKYTSETQEDVTELAVKSEPDTQTEIYSEVTESGTLSTESHDVVKPSVDITPLKNSTDIPLKFQDDEKQTVSVEQMDTTSPIIPESTTETLKTTVTTQETTRLIEETVPFETTTVFRDDESADEIPQSEAKPTVTATENIEQVYTTSEPSKYDTLAPSYDKLEYESSTKVVEENELVRPSSEEPDVDLSQTEEEHKDTNIVMTDMEPSKTYTSEASGLTQSSESYDYEITTQKILDKPSTERDSYSTEKQEYTLSQESDSTTIKLNEMNTIPPITQTESQFDTKTPEQTERTGTTTGNEVVDDYKTTPKYSENIYPEVTTVISEEPSSLPPKEIQITTPSLEKESNETHVSDTGKVPEAHRDSTLELPEKTDLEPNKVNPTVLLEKDDSPAEADQKVSTDHFTEEFTSEPPKLFDISKSPVEMDIDDSTSKYAQATESPLSYATTSQDSTKLVEEPSPTTTKAINEYASKPSSTDKEDSNELKSETESSVVESEVQEISTVAQKPGDLTTSPPSSDSKMPTQLEDKQTTGASPHEVTESTTTVSVTDVSKSSELDQQETETPGLETPFSSPATDLDVSQPETTQKPDNIKENEVSQQTTTESKISLVTDKVSTTQTEIYDLTTSKSIDTSQLPQLTEIKEEYPEPSVTQPQEQSTENSLAVSQEASTQEISAASESLDSRITSTEKPAPSDINDTKVTEPQTETSSETSSKYTSDETYTEEPVTKYSSSEPSAEYDSTKTPIDENTVEPSYNDSKEQDKPIDDLIQSLVTEQSQTKKEPLDFEKDAQTEVPINFTSVTPKEDGTGLPQHDNVKEKLSTPSSVPVDTTTKELQKPTDYESSTILPSPASETTILEVESPVDNLITQEPATTKPSQVITSTTAEQKDYKPTDMDIATEAIEPVTSFTDKSESGLTDKPLEHLPKAPAESLTTTESPSIEESEFSTETTKRPGIQTDEIDTSKQTIIDILTKTSTMQPISEENYSTLVDEITNETLEPETTTKSSTEKEAPSILEPTSSSSTSYDGKLTTESTPTENYTEKQPQSLQTVIPERATPVEEFVTTRKPSEPEAYHTTAPAAVEIINETSIRPSVPSEEGLTTPAPAREEDQSIPVATSDAEKTSTPEESITEQTERVIIPSSEKPLQETTAPEEEFIVATTKSTTVKPEQKISTPGLTTDKTLIDTIVDTYTTTLPETSATITFEASKVTPEAATTTMPVGHGTTVLETADTKSPITSEDEVSVTKAPEALDTPEDVISVTKTPTESATSEDELSDTNITNAPVETQDDALISKAPEVIVTEEQESPISSVPEEPVTKAPEVSITISSKLPESFSTEVPISSAPELQGTASTETPDDAAPEAIDTRVPEVPDTPASEAPFTNAPEIPFATESEEAITRVSDLPSSSAPEISITSSPDASITQKPEVTITIAPELTIASSPETPITAAPETPITAAPETPITAAPEPPTTKAPEPPTPALSELPKPVSTEAQPTDEALTPDEEGSFPPSGGTSGYGQEPDYVEEDQTFGPGTCRYGGKVYVSAQQIPRDDPCDFCFCFRSDIICLQQSCPPPIHGCHEEPIQGFCCPRYECPVSMATTVNVTTTTTTTTTTLPPHFPTHSYKGSVQKRGCQIKGQTYKVGEVVRASSGPCLHCTCGGDGQMKCDPKVCTPEPMLRQMIAAAVSAKRRR